MRKIFERFRFRFRFQVPGSKFYVVTKSVSELVSDSCRGHVSVTSLMPEATGVN